MFDPQAAPRLFALPPGADFVAEFATGLRDRLKSAAPHDLARIEIIVNTRRMERRLSELLGDQPTLLPRITPIAALPARFPTPGLPPARAPLKRKLDLMVLIKQLIKANPTLAPHSAIPSLADSLSALFDEMQGEGVSADALMKLQVPDASGHWQNSLEFLRIVQQYLDLADDDAADPEDRQRQAVEALINRWKAAPPQTPVIVAGSTGSRATTLMLMDAVSRLPQGALVLPGFDDDLPESVWSALSDMKDPDDHPQARYAILLDALGCDQSDIHPWTSATGPKSRNRLVSLALRPAPVTDAWLGEGPGLGNLTQATDDLELIEAPSPRIEAQAIALRLRAALQDGQRSALVTPDRMLTRQVSAALSRWGIEPDDSAGRPLALSAPGRFLMHLAGLMGQPLSARELIVLLKHPLTATGGEGAARGDHLRLTRELELYLRRKAMVFPEREALQAWADRLEAHDWLDWVFDRLIPLANVEQTPLEDLLDQHITLAEAFAAGHLAKDSGELWREKPGEAAAEMIADLRAAAPSGGDFTQEDYRSFFASVLNSKDVRDPLRPHPGVMIWGTMEARVQGADLVILAGLNDGAWPEMPDPDPWLNRAMRRELGLLLPERRIGLSAHDFQQAIAAPKVVLSRAVKGDEAATVPSRWLNRITNLIEGLPDQNGPEALAAMRNRGRHWVTLALGLDRRGKAQPSEPRPAPRPPQEARPKELPVTAIQRMIRDPYAIYARYVLGLRRIDAIDRDPDHALRGTVMHRVVEQFQIGGFDPAKPEARAAFLEIAASVFARDVPWPETRNLWLARCDLLVDQFLAQEVTRCATGVAYPPERRGRTAFDTPAFSLFGTADRIDLLHDGSMAIFDYKTGTIPTPKEVEHFDRQLLLEALIAEDGGFADVPAATVAKLEYIALSPTGQNWDFRPAETRIGRSEFDWRLSKVRDELLKLITAYDDPQQGFTSRRAVKETRFEGDYDQLARFGEWDVSDEATPGDVG